MVLNWCLVLLIFTPFALVEPRTSVRCGSPLTNDKILAAFSSESSPPVVIDRIDDRHSVCLVAGDSVRESLLYNDGSHVVQATFSCQPTSNRFDWKLIPHSVRTGGTHFNSTAYPTATNCRDCTFDTMSLFGDPSWCNVIDHPCPFESTNCLNGDTCQWTALDDFTCNCSDNWTGHNCEVCGLDSSSMCTDGKIVNHETCTCECPEQSSGPMCEYCPLSPASCTNEATFSAETCDCQCSGSWSGENCQVCPMTSADCQNGGVLNPETCQCECTPFWRGVNCQDCYLDTSMCFNANSVNTTLCVCDCEEPFVGTMCETYRLINVVESPISSPADNPSSCAVEMVLTGLICFALGSFLAAVVVLLLVYFLCLRSLSKIQFGNNSIGLAQSAQDDCDTDISAAEPNQVNNQAQISDAKQTTQTTPVKDVITEPLTGSNGNLHQKTFPERDSDKDKLLQPPK